MPNYTKNYNLIKPNKTENYDIEDVTNKNMDIIDEELFGKVDKVSGKALSTNDFTNEYKNKLDKLENYDDEDLRNKINEQVQKNNLQEEKIEELNLKQMNLQTENTQLKNQIPTGTSEGESIYLSDSSDLEAKIIVKGNSKQEGTPSAENKVDVETVGNNINLSEINELEIEQYSSNPTNVTGYIEIGKLPVTIQFEQNNNENYLGWIRYYDENKSLLNQVQKSNSLDIGKGFTITESYENAKYIAYTIRGTETTNTFPLKISKIKTEQGETATPYSPYNQGSVEIDVSNKQLFNIRDLIAGMGILNLDANDFITVSLDNSTGTNTIYYKIYTNTSKYIKPNAKY